MLGLGALMSGVATAIAAKLAVVNPGVAIRVSEANVVVVVCRQRYKCECVYANEFVGALCVGGQQPAASP